MKKKIRDLTENECGKICESFGCYCYGCPFSGLACENIEVLKEDVAKHNMLDTEVEVPGK